MVCSSQNDENNDESERTIQNGVHLRVGQAVTAPPRPHHCPAAAAFLTDLERSASVENVCVGFGAR